MTPPSQTQPSYTQPSYTRSSVRSTSRSLPAADKGSTLSIRVPADYVLARDVCSYGYFLLAPNHWDPESQSLTRTLALSGVTATTLITQPPERGHAARSAKAKPRGRPLRARFDAVLNRAAQAEARRQITRMLRLDEDAGVVRRFHTLDPRWKRSGRGRLFRSPSLFEDIVKTVTSCNVAWPSTINMNRRLCDLLGAKSAAGQRAFPSPQKLARTRPGTLRARCRVGYRDQRLIDLARLYAKGHIDTAWLESSRTSDDDAYAFLLTLPGVGPYAAGNIMQLLGRYSRLALDTESVRHAKMSLGMQGTDREILKRLATHYEPFGEHKFRAYWFELWADYESKRGPASTWDRDTTGKTFTAALLKD
ncbi:MAG: hypothetical protein AAF235_02725 [Planctomycetota bacterium]